jgi:hypothetical protein
MSNLAIKTQISPLLGVVGRSIIESLQTEKITDLFEQDKDRLKREVAEILLKAYNDLNKTFTQKEAQTLLDGVILNCINTYGSLKIGELKYSVEHGIRGEYGEYYGFSVVTIHKFIKAYKDSEDRAEALRKQIQYEDSIKIKPVTEIDKAEIEKEFWENEKIKIVDYQKTKKLYIELPIFHFKMYEEAGLIQLEKGMKAQYFDKAKNVFLKTTDFENKENRLLRTKIYEGVELTLDEKRRLSTIACKLILEDEFLRSDLLTKIK